MPDRYDQRAFTEAVKTVEIIGGTGIVRPSS
jgi:hypothetical protein